MRLPIADIAIALGIISPGFFAAAPAVGWETALVAYGPMGIGLVWFAARAEKRMDAIVAALNTGFDRQILETRAVGHRIHGMSRALLADVVSRETTPPQVRRAAEQMLHEPDSIPEHLRVGDLAK